MNSIKYIKRNYNIMHMSNKDKKVVKKGRFNSLFGLFEYYYERPNVVKKRLRRERILALLLALFYAGYNYGILSYSGIISFVWVYILLCFLFTILKSIIEFIRVKLTKLLQ